MYRHFINDLRRSLHLEEEGPKSVEDVAAKLEKELKEKGEDKEGSESEEESEEKDDKDDKDAEDEDEADEEDDELDEASLAEAKNLYKLLKDPKTSKNVVEMLAKSAGIVKDSTKEERKEAVKTIKELVQDKLGAKYAFLAADLGDLFQEIITSEVEKGTKQIKEDLKAKEIADRRLAIAEAQEKVNSEFKQIPDKVFKEVNRILQAEELTPGPNTTHAKFYKQVLSVAANNLDVRLEKTTDSKSTNKDKLDQHRKDPLKHLGSERESEKDHKQTSKIKTISDAVNEAAKLVEAGMKK